MIGQGDGVDEGLYTFRIGDVHDGPRLHKVLVEVSKIDFLTTQDERVKAMLAKNPKMRGYYIGAEMEIPGWIGTGLDGRVRQHAAYRDVNGVLQLADRPQEAPIIHFGGPWQITLMNPHRLTLGLQRGGGRRHAGARSGHDRIYRLRTHHP